MLLDNMRWPFHIPCSVAFEKNEKGVISRRDQPASTRFEYRAVDLYLLFTTASNHIEAVGEKA